MRVLVAVASRHGAIAEIAAEICMNLRRAMPDGMIQADLVAAGETPAFDRYDAVIIGSASCSGRWLSTLLGQHELQLRRLPLWLFSTWSGGELTTCAVPGDPIAAGTEVIEHRVFGAKVGREHSADAIGLPEGDFRDWAAVRAWVSQIVDRLCPSPVAQAG